MRRQPSLRSQLNQIRLWVRQGRTDAWIAHKLDVSIEQLERFKRDHDLSGEGIATARPADPLSVPPPEEPDLYEEQIEAAAELEEEAVGSLLEEPEPEPEPEPESEPEREEAPRRRSAPARPRDRGERDDDEAAQRPRRRRGRRGGRRRRRPSSYEATFDHGEEGYGLWLDPAVVDNPVYANHWAGHRAVVVTFDRDSITIRRAGAEGADEAEAEDDSDSAPEDQ